MNIHSFSRRWPLFLGTIAVAMLTGCSSQPSQSPNMGNTYLTQQGIQVGLTIYGSGESSEQQTQQPLPVIPPQNVKVTILTPDLSKPLTSPLLIHGRVSGVFYFEGTFPVLLKDQSGKVIASTTAHADSDWMTEAEVPFTAEISYKKPYPVSAILSFEKDNSSGQSQYVQDFPVTLK